MDAKDRRIAELEKANAVLTAEVKQLKSRPVLEADVLASFGAFDTNRDGLLTKDEVVAVLTRDTGAGYAMTREAAEAKWTEWVQRHDADSDGKLSYKEIAAGITHQPRKPAYMEAVKKTVKDFPFLELAGGAFAIASKVSKEVYEVDTLYGILMRGEAKIGYGDTAYLLAGKYTPGVPLTGACPIVTDNHLGLHDKALVDWRSAYVTYAAATTIGAIILAGDAEGFSTWAKSKACRAEVADVPDGRLFALIDGYLVAVFAQAGIAMATVENGKGSVVWADGGYYVGEIKDGVRHGEGTMTFPDGRAKYVGQFKVGRQHGEGTWTFANGTGYVGQFRDGYPHGFGKATLADGTILDGRLWAFIASDVDGYIVGVDAQANEVSPTVANGRGSIVWPEGDYYTGEIKDGKRHGEGTFTFEHGNTYVGQWKDDKKHGLGKATFASGQVSHDGEWVNGEPKK